MEMKGSSLVRAAFESSLWPELCLSLHLRTTEEHAELCGHSRQEDNRDEPWACWPV